MAQQDHPNKPTRRLPNVTLEDVRIVFRNFAGGPTKFNQQGGVRSFAAILPQDIADIMERDGWVVKYLKPREEGDAPQAYLPVKVTIGQGSRNKATLVSSRGRTLLTENTIAMLDFADIRKVDLIVNASAWGNDNGGGYKTYMSSIFVTINEDELDLKYANVPESSLDSLANSSQTTPNEWD